MPYVLVRILLFPGDNYRVDAVKVQAGSFSTHAACEAVAAKWRRDVTQASEHIRADAECVRAKP